MYTQVKNLAEKGFGISQISRITELDRKTARKYLTMNEAEFSDFLDQQKHRHQKLDCYEDFMVERLGAYPSCSAAQMEDWLKEHHPDFPSVSSRTIYAFVQSVRRRHDIPKPKAAPRQYHPVDQLPYGKQAQVDFGEYWMTDGDGHRVKVHFMIMVLSRSRQKFVYFSQQSITARFVIDAHELAFAFFQGIPQTIVYDQDSTMVTDENNGAILYTEAFKQYLLHRSFKTHVCRKSDPESKGKIEAGVKYVKQNFLPGRKFCSIETLKQEVLLWLERTGNGKEHSITRRVPASEWEVEKRYLRAFEPLAYVPNQPHGVRYHVRKDNMVSYRGNFYSLPEGTYAGQGTQVLMVVKDSELFLHGDDGKLLARHQIERGKGTMVVNKHHRRDTSAKLDALRDSIRHRFTNQEKAALFLESIQNRYPRYSRDQYQHIRKTISVCPQQLIDESLSYCVDHQLFSCGEFHDVLRHYQQVEEKSSQRMALKTFRPKTPQQDLDRILAFQPDSSAIATYENLLSR